MLVTSSRSVVGPLTSSAASSPGAHVHHHHLAGDLSPRSSNSSMMSSNESLLNNSLSVPSPGAREGENSPRSPRTEGSGGVVEGEISALQCLQKAFKRSPFYLQENDNENEQLEQHFTRSFPMLSSPSVGVGALFNSPNMKSESDDSNEEEMQEEVGDLSRRHQTTPLNSVRTPSTSPSSSDFNLNNANNIFQCPLCSVVYNSRHDFNEHLVTHSQQHACPKCTFITTNEDELRDHVQEIHGVDDFLEMMSDDEVKTPKTNAQGKLKTFKCKHCEYRAVTKKEFWDHTKSHIRHEKMLHCPKCPFVTEYKHHLEYHLRNHMGSKPYQCTKCAYSCVNKSMLNSHLKSHSSIYQYRCSDCSYATKYCHSLKLHLRKYNHKPAMVLNPDGTPNPLPIIDVYGTRRGPKIKRPDPILEGLATTQPMIQSHSPSAGINTLANSNNNRGPKTQKKTPVKKGKTDQSRQQQLDARDLSPKPASSPRFSSSMPNQCATPPLRKMREENNSSGDSDSELRHSSSGNNFLLKNGLTKMPQAPISPDSIAMILQRNGLMDQANRKDINNFSQQNNAHEIFAAFNQYLPLFNLNPALFQLQSAQSNNNISEQQTNFLAQLLQSRIAPAQQLQHIQHLMNDLRGATNNNTVPNSALGSANGGTGSPLDLRHPKTELTSGFHKPSNNHNNNNHTEELKRRKRKGKALRYERKFCSDDEDEDEAIDFSNNNNNTKFAAYSRRDSASDNHHGPTDLSVSSSPSPVASLLCQYCEISFPDREFYTIHMNYHSGESDPFLCRCGKRTQNKVEFFRHLNADPH